MTLDEMKIKLQKNLNPKRFKHSIAVMDTAAKLALKHGADIEKALIAGLLHDCARDIRGPYMFELCKNLGIIIDEVSNRQPELLHGPIGSRLIKSEYGVDDVDISRAVFYHTTGCSGMSMLSKIIFMADYIEPGRSFPGISEVRKEAFYDLDRAMLLALDRTINYVVSKGALLHPDTVGARNGIMLEMTKPKG